MPSALTFLTAVQTSVPLFGVWELLERAFPRLWRLPLISDLFDHVGFAFIFLRRPAIRCRLISIRCERCPHRAGVRSPAHSGKRVYLAPCRASVDTVKRTQE